MGGATAAAARAGRGFLAPQRFARASSEAGPGARVGRAAASLRGCDSGAGPAGTSVLRAVGVGECELCWRAESAVGTPETFPAWNWEDWGPFLSSPPKGLVCWGRWGPGCGDRSEGGEDPQGAGSGEGDGGGGLPPRTRQRSKSRRSFWGDAGKAAGGGARASRRPGGSSCDGSRCRAGAAPQARGLTAGRAGGAGSQGRALG